MGAIKCSASCGLYAHILYWLLRNTPIYAIIRGMGNLAKRCFGFLIAILLTVSALPAHADTQYFQNNLYYGLTNSTDVKQLQEFLTDQGDYSGPITGNFFSLTLTGVKHFQSRLLISPVSGYFGILSRTQANLILDAQISNPIVEVGLGGGTTTPPQISTTTPSEPPIAPNENTPVFITPGGVVVDANGNVVSVPQQQVAPAPVVPETPGQSRVTPVDSGVTATPVAPLSCSISITAVASNNVLSATADFSFGPDSTVGTVSGANFTSATYKGAGSFSGLSVPLSGTQDLFTLTVVRGSENKNCTATINVPQKTCVYVGGDTGYSCAYQDSITHSN